jgi:effector-binding domain-containing protein
LFRIGEFSRLSHVTVKTIRHYDKIGLLKPARVDPDTNYRYYSANQLPRLNRILALKGLGLSLDQISLLLDQDLPAAQIRGMLRLKQVEIQEHLEQERSRLDRVEQMLKQIEKEEKMPKQDITIKPIKSQEVISIRDTIPSYGEVGSLFNQVFAILGKHQIQPAGPPVGIYHDHEYQEQEVDVEIAVPVSPNNLDTSDLSLSELPAWEDMACIFHEGGYGTIGASYSALMKWVEENGYKIAGAVREIYLRGPESGPEENYLTEIQLPVNKG